MVAGSGGGLWVVVGVVGFFILYSYIFLVFFNVILILEYIILIYRIEE